MSDASLKLSDLLPARMKIDPNEMSLGEGRLLSPSMLGFVGSKLSEALASALDLDVMGVIAEAWAKTDELRELAAEAARRGEAQHIFLAKHELSSENRIKLLLEFAGMGATAQAPVIDELSLVLKAKFEGIGLTVDRGFIVAFDAGRGSAQVELRYSSSKLLGESTAWLDLPVKHRLAHPIEIGWPGEASTRHRPAATA